MEVEHGIVGLRDWTLARAVEPAVRVGIFLDGDAAAAVHLTPVRGPAVLGSPGGPDVVIEPGTEIEVRHARPALSLRISGQAARTVPSLRLHAAPVADDLRVSKPGDCEAGILLRDVPAGRGFHWEKRVSQILPGTLELSVGRHGVVLVNVLPLETYLAGVITAEMSAACPLEFLKAQAIVARSWLLAMTEPKHRGEPFDRCNDDCCQRYQGTGGLTATALAAVHDTRGVVLLSPAERRDGSEPEAGGRADQSEPEAPARAKDEGIEGSRDQEACSQLEARAPSEPEARGRANGARRGDTHRSCSILDANYSKCCGGVTETPWAVWGLDKPGIRPIVDAPPDAPDRRFFPVSDANLEEYLDGAWLDQTQAYCSPNVVAPDSLSRYLGRVDTVGDYFRWAVRYTRAELEELLRVNLTDAAGLTELRDIHVRARGASGRAYAVQIDWLDAQGQPVRSRLDGEYRIRQALHRTFLYSSAFAVRPERDPGGRLSAIVLRGAGWGHGVGMCQIGALGMALSGQSSEAICSHYYAAAKLGGVYT